MWIHAIGIHIYHINLCHKNSYLSFEFIHMNLFYLKSYIFWQYIFHNCLSNVWRAFESHQKSQVLVFTKWCDNGTGVLTFVVKLKHIVLHAIVKFSEKVVPRMFAGKMSVIIGNGYCLPLSTLFSWHEVLIQRALLSSFFLKVFSCG